MSANIRTSLSHVRVALFAVTHRRSIARVRTRNQLQVIQCSQTCGVSQLHAL